MAARGYRPIQGAPRKETLEYLAAAVTVIAALIACTLYVKSNR